MASTRLLAASLAALAFGVIIFVGWPALDLRIASAFWLGGNQFAGESQLGDVIRRIFEWMPFGVFGLMLVLYAGRRFGGSRSWAPNGASMIMMALSFGLGPGLLVNLALKDHSHRPRPSQVDVFGGTAAFRPFYRFDGACRRNCSFVSGEGSTAVWTLAPALLVPPPWRPLAVGAALAVAAATSLLRMAFGGHFASDSVFAALFTWLIVLACWRLAKRIVGTWPGSYDG